LDITNIQAGELFTKVKLTLGIPSILSPSNLDFNAKRVHNTLFDIYHMPQNSKISIRDSSSGVRVAPTSPIEPSVPAVPAVPAVLERLITGGLGNLDRHTFQTNIDTLISEISKIK
jgi:hypothetical protein